MDPKSLKELEDFLEKRKVEEEADSENSEIQQDYS